MLAVHILVGLAAAVAIATVALSVLRSVVLPRGIPTRLARIATLSVYASLRGWLRVRPGGADYATRDRVLARQAPLGVAAQLIVWTTLVVISYSALFWAAIGGAATAGGVAHAIELGGSSTFTLGTESVRGFVPHLVGFAAAGTGLILLALVITYLPTLYAAFSSREASIAKLAIRAGSPATGVALLASIWELQGFERFDDVWEGWEEWFLELGESHTTFPQLNFFRSPRPEEHWVLAAEAILDGTTLIRTVCDVEDTAHAELCRRAGSRALAMIARFVGVPDLDPDQEPRTAVPRERFDEAWEDLDSRGVPLRGDRDRAWREFVEGRAGYEPLLAALGAMTDAPRSPWSPWSEDTPRHRPPLLGIRRRRER